MKRWLTPAFAGLLSLASCAAPQAAVPPAAAEPSDAPTAGPGELAPASWIVTTHGAPFVRSTLPAIAGASGATPASGSASESPPATATVVIDAAKRAQAIEGFGGAFNEHGWAALGILPEAERDAVMRALFDPVSGLRFNHGRAPIGASDYALDRYTLNEVAGDYAMAHFSIERDEKLLIPFIHAALKLRPDLWMWASAWTPPTWMKTNGGFDSGAMKDDPRVYGAYALYLAKYVESYKGRGIDISMVVPQNEPGQLTPYPSCDWRPAQYVTFIRDHLAPTFQRRGLGTKIFVGTVNQEKWDVFEVLKDPGTLSVISGVALQWGGLAHVAPVRAAYPSLPIMQSETECGNTRRQPDYNPERPPNNFAYAAHTFRKLRDFIGRGASSYMLWNMVLDEEGKNIDTERPWPQNAAIVVDRAQKRVIYTPMFWATKHFSALVEPGAHRIETRGAFADQIAFENPDGSVVLELMNDQKAAVQVDVEAGARRHRVELPAESFGTLVIPKG